MGAKSQRKGRAAELELSRILQGYGYPVEAGRARSYGEVPDLSGLPGIHIEVKRRENVNLSAALEQARRDARRLACRIPPAQPGELAGDNGAVGLAGTVRGVCCNAKT